MSVDHSIIPSLTRADLLALAVWNAANERSRDAYYADPLAASRLEMGEVECWKCAHRRHCDCTSRANHGYALCACWLDDHEPEGAP